ncbi:MAG: polysaccharide biosynthesis tyrosine autokinase [Muribaculaceae bacterium]|nr:polysaccharide biosynthesis tyrosine autokinase [Muribaculaceae bacterium]
MAKKNNSDFIDFKSLLHQYLSHWYLFAISVVLCLVLAFIYVKRTPAEYSVKANVLISQQKDAISEAMGGLSDLFGSDGYVEDEIFIISSHTVYRDVVKSLRLNIKHSVRKAPMLYEFVYPDYPVDIIPAPGIVDTLSTGISFKIKVRENMTASIVAKIRGDKVAEVEDMPLPQTLSTPLGDFTIAATDSYPVGESLTTIIGVTGYDAAAEVLDQSVHNEIASKRSNVIGMSIETPVPDFGKAVLNEIIKKYNERGIYQKNNQGELTANFLDDRLEILAADLSATEAQIQNYKQERGITDVVVEARYQTEKKGRLEEALLEAETQAEILRITSAFLDNEANRFELIPLNTDNEALQTAIASYNDMLIRRAELMATALPDNAELRRLENRIDLKRGSLRNSMNRAQESADVAVREIRNEMNAAETRLGNIPQQEREYYDMRRQQELKSQLYFFLLKRSEENALLLANATPKGQIIDEAYTMSEPLGMSKKVIMLIALFLGLCIPPMWLYIRKMLYNRFETRADIERMTDVPILGEMCVDRSGRQLVVSSDDTSSSAELFRLMRSNLLFVLTDPRDKVVLMTSTSSGEGKSFISINLAASMALLGKKVLLVGMDIRNPQLANYLKISPRFGLTQYLSSADIKLSDIIVPLKEVNGLDVICAGPVPPNPAEMLISPKVDELFATLREQYDYIIVDTAPIGLVSDTFTLDRIADAAIYVCRANYTSLSDLELINDIYEQHRLKKVSLVVNGTAAKKSYGYKAKK